MWWGSAKEQSATVVHFLLLVKTWLLSVSVSLLFGVSVPTQSRFLFFWPCWFVVVWPYREQHIARFYVCHHWSCMHRGVLCKDVGLYRRLVGYEMKWFYLKSLLLLLLPFFLIAVPHFSMSRVGVWGRGKKLSNF